MIEVKNLTKTFDGVRVLDQLTLTVPKGAVYGLVGPNGAGKSTLLRHITGVFRPDEGEILLGGQPVFDCPEQKTRMVLIPDDVFYFPSANLKDMMKFYRGIYPGFDGAMYEKLVEVFELPEKLNLRRYSKGMQKQAAFLLSICARPEYLILDEPVDGLDPLVRRRVWSLLMQDVAERGTTILVSSHNLRELEDVCDHVGILNKGKLVLERSLSDLQGQTAKVQAVFREGTDLPERAQILHRSKNGKIETLILRGTQQETDALMKEVSPVFYDTVPLSLEEIFLYEMGGAEDEMQKLLL